MSGRLHFLPQTMIKPLVSIITLTYNHERFIRTCIESVLHQSYGRFEHIIIDDGSTDTTEQIVRSFHDSRIRYVRLPHEGLATMGKRYNEALRMARGELIAILEGDDFWPYDKLAKQAPLFENSSVVFSWGKVRQVDHNDQEIDSVPLFSLDTSLWRNEPIGAVLQKLLFFNPIRSPSVMLRTSTLRNIGGFIQPPSLPLVDYPTWLHFALQGTFATTNEVVGFYRIHPVQVTSNQGGNIEEMVALYALSFLSTVSSVIRAQFELSGEAVSKNYERRKVSRFCTEGRRLLLRQEWRAARARYAHALRYGDFLTRLKGALGITASLLHFDMEFLAKILHRPRLR